MRNMRIQKHVFFLFHRFQTPRCTPSKAQNTTHQFRSPKPIDRIFCQYWLNTHFISISVLSSQVELHYTGWEGLPLHVFLNWHSRDHCNYPNFTSQKLSNFNLSLAISSLTFAGGESTKSHQTKTLENSVLSAQLSVKSLPKEIILKGFTSETNTLPAW